MSNSNPSPKPNLNPNPNPNPNPDLNPNPNPNQVTGKMSERNVEKQQRQAAACFAGWKLGK